MKGDHFVLYRSEQDGLWHWVLHKANSPRGPIARSGQGYTSRSAAKRSIGSACIAARGASSHVKIILYNPETLADIRIDERPSPRLK